MLEKIKQTLIWVLTPFAFVLGFAYYLLSRNRSLTDEVKQAKSEQELAKILQERQDAKQEADKAEADYRARVDEYNKSHPRQGD